MKRKKKQVLPCSGNKRVDNKFRKIISVIKNKFKAIYRKKTLRDPNDRRTYLQGLISHGHKEVYIVHEPPHAPATKNLLHETLHAIHPTSRKPPSRKREERICRLEEYYWARFTDEQKKLLQRYVPKHTVKKDPQLPYRV